MLAKTEGKRREWKRIRLLGSITEGRPRTPTKPLGLNIFPSRVDVIGSKFLNTCKISNVVPLTYSERNLIGKNFMN